MTLASIDKGTLTILAALFGSIFGGAVAILIPLLNRRFAVQDKRLADTSAVKVAEITDNASMRAELWKEIQALRADLDNTDERLAREAAKSAECEKRAAALAAKVEFQEQRIKLLEAQNKEMELRLLTFITPSLADGKNVIGGE